ncbi:hypothetical protein [Pseudoduganella rivuli]|nr:hypothetical protein [Pseudoduganella rivuli]
MDASTSSPVRLEEKMGAELAGMGLEKDGVTSNVTIGKSRCKFDNQRITARFCSFMAHFLLNDEA